jgi:hypothetical protein
MDSRSARLADNEAVFRAGNEAIAANSRLRKDGVAKAGYLCECGDEQCFEAVLLTAEEYEAVRSHPGRFFVVPGHQDLTAGEIVVGESGDYFVVEKRGEEREIVERSYGRRT